MVPLRETSMMAFKSIYSLLPDKVKFGFFADCKLADSFHAYILMSFYCTGWCTVSLALVSLSFDGMFFFKNVICLL